MLTVFSSAVLLTIRDQFFERDKFQQLVYNSMPLEYQFRRMYDIPPAIVKPRQLWTGKQVRNLS